MEKEEQLKGKDVQFSIEELENIIIDEKAQIYYINKNIPTFAFEIDFLRFGEVYMDVDEDLIEFTKKEVKKIHEDITEILKAVGFYSRYKKSVQFVVPEYGDVHIT